MTSLQDYLKRYTGSGPAVVSDYKERKPKKKKKVKVKETQGFKIVDINEKSKVIAAAIVSSSSESSEEAPTVVRESDLDEEMAYQKQLERARENAKKWKTIAGADDDDEEPGYGLSFVKKKGQVTPATTDIEVPRKKAGEVQDVEVPRHSKGAETEEIEVPRRHTKKDDDMDLELPRKHSNREQEETEVPRRHKRAEEEVTEVPRRHQRVEEETEVPRRHVKKETEEDNEPPRRHRGQEDIELPRRAIKKEPEQDVELPRRHRNEEKEDVELPRRIKKEPEDEDLPRRDRKDKDEIRDDGRRDDRDDRRRDDRDDRRRDDRRRDDRDDRRRDDRDEKRRDDRDDRRRGDDRDERRRDDRRRDDRDDRDYRRRDDRDDRRRDDRDDRRRDDEDRGTKRVKREDDDVEDSLPRKHSRTDQTQDVSQQLGREAELKAQLELQQLRKNDPTSQGFGAATVYRDAKGRPLSMLNQLVSGQSEESQMEWGVGKKAEGESQKRFEESLETDGRDYHGVWKDDPKLRAEAAAQIRFGDPMAKKLKKKETVRKIRVYKGPFPTNRFNIRPGWRWDGVDRSNKFEEKVFKLQNENAAKAEQYMYFAQQDM